MDEAEQAAIKLDISTKEANISLVKAEADNKKIDNKRQLLQANDESNREWAALAVKAQGTEGASLPEKIPADFLTLYQDTEESERMQEEQQMMMQQQEQMMQQQGAPNAEQNNVNSSGY